MQIIQNYFKYWLENHLEISGQICYGDLMKNLFIYESSKTADSKILFLLFTYYLILFVLDTYFMAIYWLWFEGLNIKFGSLFQKLRAFEKYHIFCQAQIFSWIRYRACLFVSKISNIILTINYEVG